MHIKVRVKAGAKKETLRLVSPDRFEISVIEKPEGNRANRRVREMIALQCGVPLEHVRIVNGHHSPSKLLLIVSEVI